MIKKLPVMRKLTLVKNFSLAKKFSWAKKLLCCFALIPSVVNAESTVYLSGDYLTNGSKYALQYGFSFMASPEMNFGYELEYAKYSDDVHSFGVNMKPTFPYGNFYIAPIGGLHYFNDNIDTAFVYGGEVGYTQGRMTFRVGYKEASEDFKYSDNIYVGAAINF